MTSPSKSASGPSQSDREDTFFGAKINKNPFDKYAVALVANGLLAEGDSIVIDAGTSLTPIAQMIQVRAPTAYREMHYSIMTHNRPAFDILIKSDLRAHFNIFHTGGRYDDDLNASFGWLAENAYQNFFAKWVFVGQAGIVAHEGLFCHGNTEELSLKRTIFRKPGYARVVLSDASKIGIPAGLCFGEADKLKDNVDFCILLVTLDKSSRTIDLDRIDRELQVLENRYKVNVVRIEYEIERIGDDRVRVYLTPEHLDSVNAQLDKRLRIHLVQASVTLSLASPDPSVKFGVDECCVRSSSSEEPAGSPSPPPRTSGTVQTALAAPPLPAPPHAGTEQDQSSDGSSTSEPGSPRPNLTLPPCRAPSRAPT